MTVRVTVTRHSNDRSLQVAHTVANGRRPDCRDDGPSDGEQKAVDGGRHRGSTVAMAVIAKSRWLAQAARG